MCDLVLSELCIHCEHCFFKMTNVFIECLHRLCMQPCTNVLVQCADSRAVRQASLYFCGYWLLPAGQLAGLKINRKKQPVPRRGRRRAFC